MHKRDHAAVKHRPGTLEVPPQAGITIAFIIQYMMNTEPNLNSDRSHTGYSLEDKYFHDLEQQRIRDKLKEKTSEPTHCPQCKADHKAVKILGVDATECSECHGVFFNEQQVKEIHDLYTGH